MFLHSITTPSLSFSATPAQNASAGLSSSSELAESAVPAEAISPANQLSPGATVPVQPNLSEVFWGVPKNPLLTPEAPSSDEAASDIQISSAPLARPLPASFVDTGVTALVSARLLEQQGYGVPIGEAALYFKTHRPRSVRTFTNADIERLPRS